MISAPSIVSAQLADVLKAVFSATSDVVLSWSVVELERATTLGRGRALNVELVFNAAEFGCVDATAIARAHGACAKRRDAMRKASWFRDACLALRLGAFDALRQQRADDFADFRVPAVSECASLMSADATVAALDSLVESFASVSVALGYHRYGGLRSRVPGRTAADTIRLQTGLDHLPTVSGYFEVIPFSDAPWFVPYAGLRVGLAQLTDSRYVATGPDGIVTASATAAGTALYGGSVIGAAANLGDRLSIVLDYAVMRRRFDNVTLSGDAVQVAKLDQIRGAIPLTLNSRALTIGVQFQFK